MSRRFVVYEVAEDPKILSVVVGVSSSDADLFVIVLDKQNNAGITIKNAICHHMHQRYPMHLNP